MNVLLVHPSPLMYTKIYLRLEPLGLELVAAAARRAGHDVTLIDLQVESHASFVTLLQEIAAAKQATPAQIGAFLAALRMKGETVDEIVGCARAMKRSAVPVRPAIGDAMLVDVVGTGGDSLGTFNISTTAAFVVAGHGVKLSAPSR